MPLDPSRSVAELRELRQLTGDDNGAQRVAWTGTWESARAWLRENLVGTGAREEIDEAGNQWFTLPGSSERALLLGGHRLAIERRKSIATLGHARVGCGGTACSELPF